MIGISHTTKCWTESVIVSTVVMLMNRLDKLFRAWRFSWRIRRLARRVLYPRIASIQIFRNDASRRQPRIVNRRLSHDWRLIHHLTPLHTRSGNPLEACLTVSTLLWTQGDDFVRGFDKTERLALMAYLSSCFLATGHS